MALTPVTTNDASARVSLDWESGQLDLSNIDMQYHYKKAIHKVQSMESQLGPYCSQVGQKATFDWHTLINKRDPSKRSDAVPTAVSKANEYDTVGVHLEAYDDASFLVDYTVANATINVPLSVMESFRAGYERLMDRVRVAAMLAPVNTRVTKKPSGATPDWKAPSASSTLVSLEDARIGGVVKNTSGTASLEKPTFEHFQKVKRKFWDNNVMRNSMLYGLMTPGMEELLQNTTEYKNRDYIYQAMNDKSNRGVDWMGIYWVKVTPEIAPGAFYASKYLVRPAAGVTALSDATSTATNNFDLSATNHEVVPIWIKDNIIVSKGMGKLGSKFSIVSIPEKYQTPQIQATEWCGGTRVQNLKHFNLVIPV